MLRGNHPGQTMYYENHTRTTLRLIHGDLRGATDSLVVIGRDPNLRNHFEQVTQSGFQSLPSWFRDFPVQVSQGNGRTVLRTWVRPTSSSRNQERQIRRLRSAIQWPLAFTRSDIEHVALAPVSCRSPRVVAQAMVRMIWDISVAGFLGASLPYPLIKPTRFSIYSTSSLQPIIDVLEKGHYPSLRNDWLFNTAVGIDRSKLATYLQHRKFRFFQTTESDLGQSR